MQRAKGGFRILGESIGFKICSKVKVGSDIVQG